MKPVLISACLLGEPCRYDGKSKPLITLKKLTERYQLIPICPEVLGGLKTPRMPCERKGNKILSKDGQDFTTAFQEGAEKVLQIAKKANCKIAILKEKSPSCGVEYIYDGTFTNTLKKSSGLTTDLLKREGLNVLSENHLEYFEDLL